MKTDSSAIKSVDYLPDQEILQIQFVSGSIYQYFHVPESVYLEFINASSLGQYFSKNIRDQGYEFRRIH